MFKLDFNNAVPEAVLQVCRVLQEAGGVAWLVGGCVRDLSLGFVPKDWDIEVFELAEDKLEPALRKVGRCEHVGKHFGVYKLWLSHFEVDVALPRRERKTGDGHKGFAVMVDPNLKPEVAVLRRDFTLNAMMFNPLNQTLLDFHGGLQDLRNKRLKHVSPAFAEDPLRPLRAMQLAGRLKCVLDQNTAKLCRTLLAEAHTLPMSRVWQEWLKWSSSDKPSLGLEALQNMGWDKLYPELKVMQECPQDNYWHPEGDVWVHTSMVVDEAARLAKERGLQGQDKVVLLFAALCHDLGKPLTTAKLDDGKIVCPNHGAAGVQPSRDFLSRIGAPKWLKQAVIPLVKEHIVHFTSKLTDESVRCLAHRLQPMHICLWEMLTEADACGRHPAPPERPALEWLKRAELLQVVYSPVTPIITGKLLLSQGLRPSVYMGKLLDFAYQAQMRGDFNDKASALIWLGKQGLANVNK
ncbi:CCA tRNA nucleotidyltransferase [Ghiorsea bivora]|uniref:CCA tRNA nucleotidyltransferase n=1 Tax=Ghiorsea bivora TaxID=1485545 RepID=UPI00056DC6B4|nr:HD domain-containing protein [Ghiorsea bivora]